MKKVDTYTMRIKSLSLISRKPNAFCEKLLETKQLSNIFWARICANLVISQI